MIELSITPLARLEATQPVLRKFWLRSRAFSRTCVVRSCLVFVLASAPFGQTPLAKQIGEQAQTSNTVEGLKLLMEGQRISQAGTRASLNEACKYKAESELFEKTNSKGIGRDVRSRQRYSSLGQKREH